MAEGLNKRVIYYFSTVRGVEAVTTGDDYIYYGMAYSHPLNLLNSPDEMEQRENVAMVRLNAFIAEMEHEGYVQSGTWERYEIFDINPEYVTVMWRIPFQERG